MLQHVTLEDMDKTVLRDVGTVLTTRSVFLRLVDVKTAVSSGIKASSVKIVSSLVYMSISALFLLSSCSLTSSIVKERVYNN